MNDTVSTEMIAPPTEPGFYQYVGGNQNMVFLLDLGSPAVEIVPQWHVIFHNGTMARCEWGYIEQALGVFDLVRIGSEHMYHIPESPKMLKETLSVAQVSVAQVSVGKRENDGRKIEHIQRLQVVIDECSRKRPTGTDGKHNDLHTPECGCKR